MITLAKQNGWSAAFRKYYAVVRINTRNSLVYTWDAIAQGVLIAIFMLIFARLWQVTFAAQGAATIGGMTLLQTIWYFVWAEAIQLSKMNVSFKMQQEVQDGTLAYTLGRPYNYLLYHFFSGVGEVLVRFSSTLVFGSFIALIEAGTPRFIRWETLPLLMLVTLLALVVDFCMSAMIGLTAFFFEDTMAFRLIYQKLLLVLGGVLLPLDFLPDGVQTVARLLPFNAVIYAPARLFVAWDNRQFIEMITIQGVWILVLGFLLSLFFRYGARMVSINGAKFMRRLNKEMGFVWHLIQLGLAGLMEYRASFLMQAVGMFINNGVYLVFWMLFFDRFQEVKGYQLEQIFLLFGFVALGFGIAYTFAGNAGRLAEFIAQGRLDYYLTLPRPVLPHILFSRMGSFSVGDLTFGLMMYFFVGQFDLISPVLYLLCAVLAAVIFVSFSVITGCAAFYIGNANFLHMQLQNAMITFSLYPMGLFQGTIRLILFTLIPAAFVGAVPVEIVQTRSVELLLGMVGIAIFSVFLMTVVFHIGLRRYESGSALNVNI